MPQEHPLNVLGARGGGAFHLATGVPTRRGAAQYMFNSANALSDCNKLSIHTSFEAQIPSIWGNDWASVTCATPSLPPLPPLQPPAPPVPALPPASPPPLPPPDSPPEPPTTPPSLPPPEPPMFSNRDSLQAALGEWCADAAAAQATHGPISAWDVSAVTDMEKLLYEVAGRGTFDEDLNAWDVGQVTTMDVRSRPRREPEGLGWWQGGRSFAIGAPTLSVRVRRRGAVYVARRERFQPARGSVGRWPGHQHVGAPPPTRVLWVLCHRSPPLGVRVRWRRAGYVLQHARFQSARGSVGRWPGHQHVGALLPARGAGGGWPFATGTCKPSMLIQRVRAVARRRVCFTTRSLSISPWLRGTLARSPPCECAAARVGSRRGWGGGSLPLEH